MSDFGLLLLEHKHQRENYVIQFNYVIRVIRVIGITASLHQHAWYSQSNMFVSQIVEYVEI